MTEKELCEYYVELLDLAQRVCRSQSEAEEIVSDTILSALQDINSGNVIDNPAGYLRVLFSRRKNDYLRRRYLDNCVIWDDGTRLSLIAESKRDEIELRHSEADEAKVRRELSRLTAIYREVMVRHYMCGESVEKIASSLGIPEGTVKRRLSSGRQQLRESISSMENQTKSELFDSERHYSSHAYKPKRLYVSIGGWEGRSGEPFTVINRSLVAQNLLIAAYQKPLSVRALADSLGIPAPYIEFELEKLVESELMGRTAGGLYYTRIFITEETAKFGDISAEERLASELCGELWQIYYDKISQLSREIKSVEAMSEKQYSTLLLFMFNRLLTTAIEKIYEKHVDQVELPARPNGGSWLATGVIDLGSDYSEDEIRVIRRYHCSGPAQVQKDGCMMFDMQSCFGDAHERYGGFKYRYDLREILPFYASFVTDNIKPNNPQIYELVPDFEQLHILHRNPDGVVKLDIPVLSNDEHTRFSTALDELLPDVTKVLEVPLDNLIESTNINVPETVDACGYYKHFGACRALSIAVMLAAVERGLFPYHVEIGKTPLILVILQ